MPHIPVHPSAQKRRRQNPKRREQNRTIKTRVRTAVKQAAQAAESADLAAAKDKLREATKALYKAKSSGAMHRNTVRRQVARLAARLDKAEVKGAAPKA
jgi:small subunit ribosomal protein S20